jgi:hypothetical protein
VDTGARLHRRPTRGRGPRVPVPAAGCGRVRRLRFELRGQRVHPGGRDVDGGRPDAGSGQRHPRDRIGRTERRAIRRHRGRRLHRARRSLGQPDLRHIDESRAYVRPRPRRRQLHRLLGLHCRSAPRCGGCGRRGVRRGRGGGASGSGAAQGGIDTEVSEPGKA